MNTRTALRLSALVLAIALVRESQAQVVQLPSYRNFSTSGGAWVPDGGTAILGGTRYSASSSSTRGWGPFSSRATGGVQGGSSISASVQIIDLQAMDEAILAARVVTPIQPTSAAAGSVVASTASSVSPLAANAGRRFLSSGDAEDAKSGAAVSDPNAWQRALSGDGLPEPKSPSQAESDVRYYLQRGREAETANRVLAARVYYKMALESMTPEILERYQRILTDKQQAENSAAQAATAATANQAGRQSF